MMVKTCLLGTSLVVMVLAGSAVAETRTIEDVEGPAKDAPMASWTPVQQYLPTSGRGRAFPSSLGYRDAGGMLMFADELGDNLSELGRLSVIYHCFAFPQGGARDALSWALCGSDVKALDLKKLEDELKAGGISPQSQATVLKSAQEWHATAMKIGEAVETAAKDDPGVAQVLALADSAKAEWSKWLSANKDAFGRYLALKDAVRSGKSNHKSFAGCWEATAPAFEKLVKAAKFPWELSGDYLPGYMSFLLTGPDHYIKAASFAACAYSVHEGGEALAAAALNHRPMRGAIQVGWRTLALAKAWNPKFKPRFADRGLAWNEYQMLSAWRENSFGMPGVNGITAIATPVQGVIAKVKKDGDVTTLSFKKEKVETCLQRKDTRKVLQIAPNGDVIYEKVCVKYGKVDSKNDDIEVATKFATGLKPGISVLIVNKYPVTAWQGKKFVAVFGVPKK